MKFDLVPEESQLERIDACPYCKSVKYDRLFVDNSWPYEECGDCSLIFLGRRIKEEHVSQIYDKAGYHGNVDAGYLLRMAARQFDLLRMPGGQKLRIHEDGAGNGAFLAHCRSLGHEASGTDLGKDSVERAKALFGVTVKQGDIFSSGIEPGSLDVFAAFNLLCHLYRPWEYLAHASSLLKPGGRLILRTGNRNFFFKRVRGGGWSAPEHVFHYNNRLLFRMLAGSGFEVVKTRAAFDADFPYSLLAANKELYNSRLARSIGPLLVRFWNVLRLPKEDVYLLCGKKDCNVREKSSLLKKAYRSVVPVKTRKLVSLLRSYAREFGLPGGCISFFKLHYLPLPQVSVGIGRGKSPVRLRRKTTDYNVFNDVFINNEFDGLSGPSVRVIVDLGAYTGLSSVFFANKYPRARIIALEPEQSNFDLLKKNASFYKNIECVHAAVWKHAACLEIFDEKADKWSCRYVESSCPSGGGTTALDVPGIMERFGLDRIDIMKCDIEGAEREIFSEKSAWLERVDQIIVELHDRYAPGASDAVFAAAQKNGFEITQKGEKVLLSRRRMAESEAPSSESVNGQCRRDL
ncbi:MAG: hypothetical protein A2583_03760 [Bdellovibrionales bacterium RIFOXYD1_FULL_53_11]|nr:MAG: hypothetical protein A2583_03760 [Bdellovibrionales bacterium RIFOXYD1_FULL_53_11]